MIGPDLPLKDIVLEDIDLILGNFENEAPVNAPDIEPDVGQSSLSPDTEGKEEPLCVNLDPYKIKVDCPCCDRTLRFVVASLPRTLRNFQALLLEDLHFVCPSCVKKFVHNG